MNAIQYKQMLIDEHLKSEQAIKAKRSYLNIGSEIFMDIFTLQAELIMRDRNIKRNFEFDSVNTKVILDLYNYFTGFDNVFNGSLDKGILLVGPFGTGKTIILSTFVAMVNNLTEKKIKVIHSKQLPSVMQQTDLVRIPIFIDDLGKEPRVIKDFGTEIQPVVDLMAQRYDRGSWTLATSNYNLDSMKEFYGETISDRFKEMFNIIVLNGKNRRK